MNSLELDSETKGDLQSDIQTLEAQLSNSKLKKKYRELCVGTNIINS